MNGVKTSRDNSTTYAPASSESTPDFIICAVVLSSLHLSIQRQWLFLNCSNTSMFKRICCYNWNLCWRNFKACSEVLGASHQKLKWGGRSGAGDESHCFCEWHLTSMQVLFSCPSFYGCFYQSWVAETDQVNLSRKSDLRTGGKDKAKTDMYV